MLQAISAKVNGEPCCDWVGEDGAGHFVKMVHNGIEYGDMQLITEAYHLMKDVLGNKNHFFILFLEKCIYTYNIKLYCLFFNEQGWNKMKWHKYLKNGIREN